MKNVRSFIVIMYNGEVNLYFCSRLKETFRRMTRLNYNKCMSTEICLSIIGKFTGNVERKMTPDN